MNEFERRWNVGASTARRVLSERSTEAPFGFATRVVAKWQSCPAPSLVSLWQWQAWRVLKAAIVLLIVSLVVNAAAEMSEPSAPALAAPAVEETVTDAISML